jgi:hypothetical protein
MSNSLFSRFAPVWLPAVTVILTLEFPGTGLTQTKDKFPDDAYLTSVQAALSQLADEVERFQQTLITEPGGAAEKTLFRQVDSVLGEVVAFQKALKVKPARAEVYKRFDELDVHCAALYKAMEAVEKDQAKLDRSLQYLRAASEYLHFAVSDGDVSDARKQQIIERQARALAVGMRELVKAAKFALAETTGREVLISDLQNLLQAAEAFSKNASGSDVADRFKIVNQSWEKVVPGLSKLPPRENVFLLRAAVRIDQLHERLYTLLGIKGERPRLVIPT